MPLLVVDAGSGHTLTDAPVSSLIRLPHPRTGVVVQYLKVGATLCELQRVRPPTPASYFVGQEVHTDGALTLATRVDPGFLLLRALAVNGARFSRTALVVLKRMLNGEKITQETSGLTKREWAEFQASIAA